MTKTDYAWIKSMEWCSKYWGCHQMPDRSFFINGYQMPVCARCFGMMVGEILGIISAIFFQFRPSLCLIALIPMAIDGTLQYKTAYISNNFKRFLTGFLFGFGLLHLTCRTITNLIK